MNHWAQAVKDKLGLGVVEPRSIEEHLATTAKWLLHAQTATPDDGVAHSYDIRQRKWLASYPETTGYIIPTFYDYAANFNQPVYRAAAEKMAHWEVDVQLPGGGVRAGTMAAEIVTPTIFNTGQVLFGLARAARETGDERILASLIRAANWLVDAQDSDGCWRRFHSPFTTTKMATYNTRSAFGLVRAFEVTQDSKYLEAAERNVAWASAQAQSNGWLPGNCLTDNADDSALTHTIAYSIRGLLEVGLSVGKPQYVEHALQMAKAVSHLQSADGSLPAYYSPSWEKRANWTCVTGNAQMAINWMRLARETGEKQLNRHAELATRFCMSVQNLQTQDLNTWGAVKGSHPINGGYMTWRYPNWAAKFLMDALMLQKLGNSVTNIG